MVQIQKRYGPQGISILLAFVLMGCHFEAPPEQNKKKESLEVVADQRALQRKKGDRSARLSPEKPIDIPEEKEPVSPPENVLEDFPSIEVEVDEFDMGFISLDEPTVQEMEVYNWGKEVLVISKVTTSCGCTKGEMKSNTIAPGGVGILEITVDPNRFKGFETTKVISLHSNDPNTPKATVRVTSRIKGEVKFSQKQVDFGALNKEATAEEKIRMTQTQVDGVDILSTNVPDEYAEHVSVEIVDVPESEWKEATLAEKDLVIRVAPGLPVGAHKIDIQLDLNHERYKGFKIPVTLGIEGAYTFKPDAITLRNVIPGDVQEGVMELSFTETIEVLSATIDNENIQVAYKEGAEPNTYTFDVWIPENHELRLQRGELTVLLKIKGNEVEHKIRVLALLKR